METCQEECAPGYRCRPVASGGGDPTFLCVYDHLYFCRPCANHAQCTPELVDVPVGRCVEAADGSGSFCVAKCAFDEECPVGATCQAGVVPDEPELTFCAKSDGLCECSWVALGATTACQITADEGTCVGERSCEAGGSRTAS